MPGRLSPPEIVDRAVLLDPETVPYNDPRLGSYDQILLRPLALFTPLLLPEGSTTVHFVEWPDLALGVVVLNGDPEQRAAALMESYEIARRELESLTLRFFTPAAGAHAN